MIGRAQSRDSTRKNILFLTIIRALYTDGVTEAQEEDGNFFGEDRLKKVIDENLDKSALIIEDKILSALSNFTGDAPQSDDLTLMIIRRE